jgi:hypothetical protein
MKGVMRAVDAPCVGERIAILLVYLYGLDGHG